MFIDNYQREFYIFADENGYEVVSIYKRVKKTATFNVTLKIKGTDIELDFVVTDYEFKSITKRTRGVTENLTKKWQRFVEKREGNIYSTCLNGGINFLPF